MATPYELFSNYTLTASTADAGRMISFSQDWLGVIVRVAEVTGAGATADFRVQWSDDNTTWYENPTPDRIATVTAPGVFVLKAQISAPFWRVGADVTGTDPSITCSAAALV